MGLTCRLRVRGPMTPYRVYCVNRPCHGRSGCGQRDQGSNREIRDDRSGTASAFAARQKKTPAVGARVFRRVHEELGALHPAALPNAAAARWFLIAKSEIGISRERYAGTLERPPQPIGGVMQGAAAPCPDHPDGRHRPARLACPLGSSIPDCSQCNEAQSGAVAIDRSAGPSGGGRCGDPWKFSWSKVSRAAPP